MWKRKLSVLAYLGIGVLMFGACLVFFWLLGQSISDTHGEMGAQQVPSLGVMFGGFGLLALFLFGYRAWSLSLQYHFFFAQVGKIKYLPPKLLLKALFGVGYSYTIGVVAGFLSMPILLLGFAKYSGMNATLAFMSLMQDFFFLGAVLIIWVVFSSAIYIRLSLVFPAIAYGKNAGLLGTWEISKGHGIRLCISALLFLAFTALVLPLTFLAQVVDGMAGVVLLATAGLTLVLSEVLWNALFAVWYKELLVRDTKLKRKRKKTLKLKKNEAKKAGAAAPVTAKLSL